MGCESYSLDGLSRHMQGIAACAPACLSEASVASISPLVRASYWRGDDLGTPAQSTTTTKVAKYALGRCKTRSKKELPQRSTMPSISTVAYQASVSIEALGQSLTAPPLHGHTLSDDSPTTRSQGSDNLSQGPFPAMVSPRVWQRLNPEDRLLAIIGS
jgi:hypothetical protein